MKLHAKITAISLLLVFLLVTNAPAETFRTVALTGQPAPGTSPGTTFSGFVNTSIINAAGQAAFVAYLAGPGVTTTIQSGIWSEGTGTLSLVARSGTAAPGTGSPATTFTGFFDLTQNNDGHIAFVGYLGNDRKGIWTDRTGDLELIARTHTPTAILPNGETYRDILQPAMNDAGRIAFGAFTDAVLPSDGIFIQGIWSESTGALEPLARAGDQADHLPQDATYRSFPYLHIPDLNNAGQSTFVGGLEGTGVDSTNNGGIWFGSPNNLTLVARTGTQAPDMANGINFRSLGAAIINESGRIAFSGELVGTGITAANDEGLWTVYQGTPTILALEGQHGSGAPPGVVFGTVREYHSVFATPTLNEIGQSAFYGFLAGSGVDETNDQSIWSGDIGSPSLIVRTGDQAPGLADGITFDQLSFPAFNNLGQVAFTADIRGPGVTSSNKHGIWTHANGTTQLIARKGDLFEVLPGEFRTIGDLLTMTGTPGRPDSLNDAGELVFWASFTDGSQGIFVASLSVVPEPHSLTLIAAAIPIIRRTRRANLR